MKRIYEKPALKKHELLGRIAACPTSDPCVKP